MALFRRWVAGVGRTWGQVDLTADVAGKLPAVSGGVPPGTGMDYWGAALPDGYLWADGGAVSRTTYASLFAALGTTFGVGDGSTTFNLPDKRGRASVARDDLGGSAASRITVAGCGINGTTLGAAGGTQTHTLTEAQMPAHTHTVLGQLAAQGGAAARQLGGGSSNVASGSAGSGAAHQNVQPSILSNYIIKI